MRAHHEHDARERLVRGVIPVRSGDYLRPSSLIAAATPAQGETIETPAGFCHLIPNRGTGAAGLHPAPPPRR